MLLEAANCTLDDVSLAVYVLVEGAATSLDGVAGYGVANASTTKIASYFPTVVAFVGDNSAGLRAGATSLAADSPARHELLEDG